MAKTVAVVVLAGLAGLLVGCEGPRQFTRVKAGAGASWNAVLPSEVVIAGLRPSGSEDTWTMTRNDGHLNARPTEPILATNAWPEPKRPSLRRPRYIHIRRSPESFLFYQTETRYEFRRAR